MRRPRPGEILAGKYRITKVLASGGMGLVAEARNVLLDQRVAVKLMRQDVRDTTRARDRFLREARAAGRLRGPHITRVLDTGVLADGGPFIVMELLEGRDLASTLKREGPLACEMVVDLALQACEALAEAHAAGIVHRDLKPANLFLTTGPHGRPLLKVLDFGVAKANALTEGSSGLTRTDTIVGTPAYMSPEQLKSAREVDARTDVWSLGATLFELLSGRPPFLGETSGDVFAKIVQDERPRLGEVAPDVPAGLVAAIERCLAPDREDRFADVGELAQALEGYGPSTAKGATERVRTLLRERPASVEDEVGDEAPGSEEEVVAAGSATRTDWGTTQASAVSERRRRRWFVPAIALAGVAAFGGIVLVRNRLRSDSPRVETSVTPTSAPVAASTTTAPTNPAAETVAKVPESLTPATSAPSSATSSPIAPPRVAKPTTFATATATASSTAMVTTTTTASAVTAPLAASVVTEPTSSPKPAPSTAGDPMLKDR